MSYLCRSSLNICSLIRRFFLILLVMLGTTLSPDRSQALEQHIEIVTLNQWPQYVNGTNILALPQVTRMLRLFEETDLVSILILHPNTDTGLTWARSLVNWLVSFGIPNSHLKTTPGIDNINQLTVTITDHG
ncbi:MAG: hypothetical protein GKR96_10390 [Gammaproteobacteria bacterium]|nr:hypothetical protein [Gammaproteobacteria bacterium]